MRFDNVQSVMTTTLTITRVHFNQFNPYTGSSVESHPRHFRLKLLVSFSLGHARKPKSSKYYRVAHNRVKHYMFLRNYASARPLQCYLSINKSSNRCLCVRFYCRMSYYCNVCPVSWEQINGDGDGENASLSQTQVQSYTVKYGHVKHKILSLN